MGYSYINAVSPWITGVNRDIPSEIYVNFHKSEISPLVGINRKQPVYESDFIFIREKIDGRTTGFNKNSQKFSSDIFSLYLIVVEYIPERTREGAYIVVKVEESKLGEQKVLEDNREMENNEMENSSM